jgi:hypothetical protein
VGLDRRRTEEELGRDLCVGRSLGYQFQNLYGVDSPKKDGSYRATAPPPRMVATTTL